MVSLYSKEKYLSSTVIDQCFVKGQHNYVDKVITGNGFSTGFFKMMPPEGKINIMIAPNKAVVKEKEMAYSRGEIDTYNSIVFLYQESTDRDWQNAKLIVFVADSFRLMLKELKFHNQLVDKVLIDECHSVEIQSSFRQSLVDFDKVVDNIYLPNSAVVSVTASPNKYSKITHTIINEHIPETIINYSYDKNKAMSRLKALYNTGKKIVVATQDSKIIVSLAENKKLTANFIVGDSFVSNLSKKIAMTHSPGSRLVIISSRGFEGFDIYGKGYHVFFFEDRSFIHETFFISNLYQAVNRTRDGAEYIEYCRNMRASPRALVREVEVLRYVRNDSINVEKKLGAAYDIYKHLRIERRVGSKIEIDINSVSIGLNRERNDYDSGFSQFQEFLDKRNIKIIALDLDNNRMKSNRTSREQKIEMLFLNKKNILDKGLFGTDHRITVRLFEKDEQYIKHIDEYFIEKDYDQEYILTDRNKVTIDLMSNSVDFNGLVDSIVYSYCKKSIDKWGYKESKKYREEFKEKGRHYVWQLIQAFTNDRISLPKNIRAHRDYNLFTEMHVGAIEEVSSVYGVTMTEIDIRNAFPRLLYAFAGLYLPDDFYGKDKKNKIIINKNINRVWYNKEYKTAKEMQKSHAIKRLVDGKIHGDVINYLMENYFETPYKSDLFHFLSYHESEIIRKVKAMIIDKNTKIEGIVRRHDSVIVFGELEDLSFLPEIEYEGQIGWFDQVAIKDNLPF